MKIGALSARLGLTARTLRYWEERGLLPPARRTDGGTRLYGSEHVQCARGVQRLKCAGLGLDEIVELQQGMRRRSTALEGMGLLGSVMSRHSQRLRERIRELQGLLGELESGERCIDLCNGCDGKVYDADCIACLDEASGHTMPDSLRSVLEAATTGHRNATNPDGS